MKRRNPTAYKVTQICYHFEYLTILTVLYRKLFQVSVISCEDVGYHIAWGYFG